MDGTLSTTLSGVPINTNITGNYTVTCSACDLRTPPHCASVTRLVEVIQTIRTNGKTSPTGQHNYSSLSSSSLSASTTYIVDILPAVCAVAVCFCIFLWLRNKAVINRAVASEAVFNLQENSSTPINQIYDFFDMPIYKGIEESNPYCGKEPSYLINLVQEFRPRIRSHIATDF